MRAQTEMAIAEGRRRRLRHGRALGRAPGRRALRRDGAPLRQAGDPARQQGRGPPGHGGRLRRLPARARRPRSLLGRARRGHRRALRGARRPRPKPDDADEAFSTIPRRPISPAARPPSDVDPEARRGRRRDAGGQARGRIAGRRAAERRQVDADQPHAGAGATAGRPGRPASPATPSPCAGNGAARR